MTSHSDTAPRILVSWVAFAILAVVATVLLMLTRSAPVQAFETGQVLHNGNPDNGGFLCSECHARGAPVPEVQIIGPSELAPGESGTFTVTVTGGPQVVAGFNLSTSGHLGDLDTLDADTRLFFNEITHTQPKPFSNGAAAFDFTWTAPQEAQPVTLHAAGLSANGDGSNSGDAVASTTFVVEVSDPADGEPSGDVNDDGLVDTSDVQAVLATVAGRQLEVFDLTEGDLNSDGVIGLIDALLLAQRIR